MDDQPRPAREEHGFVIVRFVGHGIFDVEVEFEGVAAAEVFGFDDGAFYVE